MRQQSSKYMAGMLLAGMAFGGCNNSNPAGPSQPDRSSAPPTSGFPGTAQTTQNPDKADHGAIGVSLLTMTNPFFKIVGDAIDAEGKKSGYTVTVTAGEMDAARQKDQVNDFIVKKVGAIILSPVDSRSIGTAIMEANKAGIPVFTADIASLDPNAKVVSHIATDNYGGGKMAAQAMVQALKGKGTVAIITYPEVESVIQREKGFREVIAQNPGIKIVAELPGRGERDTSFRAAQDILEKHPTINGIFAINDPSALGAVAAIEKAGKTGKISVIGFDGMPEAKQAIKDGKIYADIVQYPEKIGTMTMQTVAKYMAGGKVEAQSLIPPGTYTKADADKDTLLK